MTNPRRRAELRAERYARDEAEQVERYRVSQLSLYDRIEEIGSLDDVKAFLHSLCERMGIDVL